jgi:hypothetical protein
MFAQYPFTTTPEPIYAHNCHTGMSEDFQKCDRNIHKIFSDEGPKLLHVKFFAIHEWIIVFKLYSVLVVPDRLGVILLLKFKSFFFSPTCSSFEMDQRFTKIYQRILCDHFSRKGPTKSKDIILLRQQPPHPHPSKVVVPIPDSYLVPLLFMHCVHFNCIGKCVSRVS